MMRQVCAHKDGFMGVWDWGKLLAARELKECLFCKILGGEVVEFVRTGAALGRINAC